MKISNQFFIYLSLFSILFFSACNSDEVVIEDPVELITNMNFTLTSSGDGSVVQMTFKDEDGDGGIAPEITGGTLQANSSYSGELVLTNNAASPAEIISDEIKEEDLDHQFFFSNDGINLTISYDDQDADGNPLGLKTTVTTVDSGAGNLTITLRHQPDKNASGVSQGDITNAGGETDIEVVFPITIE